MKPQKPLPKAQNTVYLKEAETIKCSKCSNYLFITSFVLKRLSAILSPSGQEALIPVQVYSCGNCGAVAEGMLTAYAVVWVTPPLEDIFSPSLNTFSETSEPVSIYLKYNVG